MMSRHSNARGVRKDQSASMPRDPLPQSGWKVLGIDLNSEHFRSAPRTCRSRSGKSTAQARRRPGREARPAEDRQRDRTEGAEAACKGLWYLEGSQIAGARDWHGTAHCKGAWVKGSAAIFLVAEP